MREINIFLASSITELHAERNEIDVFIRRFSDWLEDEYDVRLRPIRCENIDPKYTVERKQEEYNCCLRDCDLAYFIFLSRVGEYTREEFEVAKKQFEESGSPQCYIYVIEREKERCEPSLFKFLKELEQVYHFPYQKCQDMDMLKRQMQMSIWQWVFPSKYAPF